MKNIKDMIKNRRLLVEKRISDKTHETIINAMNGG